MINGKFKTLDSLPVEESKEIHEQYRERFVQILRLFIKATINKIPEEI